MKVIFPTVLRQLAPSWLVAFLIFESAANVFAQYPPEAHAYPVPILNDTVLAAGPFNGTDESLKQYQCPEWFRNAKFGIWSHWGPQSVPMTGDWYARKMYIEGTPEYESHLKKYGHPSVSGYKDIIALWKAEKFDPERLMTLYQYAGAKYFVSMGAHHDNFDLWNSKYHKWNAVQMGPHRDIVGEWAAAARRHGLRFGVSEHLERSYSWFNTNKGSDKTGPLAGVPYDGNDPKYADLYFPPHEDTRVEYPINPPEWWKNEWRDRIEDLVDSYRPDLLYTDGAIPFGEVGRDVVAHFYNANTSWHSGKLEAVYNIKNIPLHGEYIEGACVQDKERGVLDGIKDKPWQTDTSIGDWFYNPAWPYSSAGSVIRMLVDIVSKNGNLLLNITQRPDGSLDTAAEQFLNDMGAWMKVNGEAIYGTRPWTIYGEGPSTRAKAANDAALTAHDLRFTRKGDDLYVTALGIPTGQVVIRALASDSPLVTGQPRSVALLGASEPLQWTRSTDGLIIQLPPVLPCKEAVCFKISGLTTVSNLDPTTLNDFEDKLAQPLPIQADAEGNFDLQAEYATLQGSKLQIQTDGNTKDIGYWDNPEESVSWKIDVTKPGTYEASVNFAADANGSEYVLDVGDVQLTGLVANSAGYYTYRSNDLGPIQINQTGLQEVRLHSKSSTTWKPLNLHSIQLKFLH